ncbi:MAG: hypothetical protein ACFFAS_03695 [Promethearchaeota archaeon]
MNSVFEILSGRQALTKVILESINQVKSSIIIYLPEPNVEVLNAIIRAASRKKGVQFLLISNFQDKNLESITNELKSIKNIQLRRLTSFIEFISTIRDTEELILCPLSANEEEMIGFRTTLQSYYTLYSKIIGPIFLANSRPLK